MIRTAYWQRLRRRIGAIGLGWVLLGAFLVRPTTAAPPASVPSPQPVQYCVVVTGSELLIGTYPDAHTQFLTRTLHPLGLRCVGSVIVGDDRGEIQRAVRFGLERAKLVIVTGGLGPTDNDVTREALAEFTGIAVQEHPDVLQELERRFKTPRDQLRPNLRRQTRVPTQGTYFPNPNGTAVGLVFEHSGSAIVALPGPPRELQPMVRDHLVPFLSRRFGTRLPGCSLTLRFVGLGQSQIDQTLKNHVRLPPAMSVYSHFEGSRVDFVFSLPDDTPTDRARLQQLKADVAKYLGEYLYADDTTSLEQHVAALLEARHATLALAEVGSGGSVASALSAAPSGAKVLAGACEAPTEEKLCRLLGIGEADWQHAASSVERTRLLARGVAQRTGSAWALAIGEPQKDPSGARYVEVVVQQPGGIVRHDRVGIRGSGELAQAALTTQVLDLLRRSLH